MSQASPKDKSDLRVLIVEDSAKDAQLIELLLRRGGFAASTRRVDSAETLRVAMQEDSWDLIISDYEMPGFTGLDALSEARERDADIPFIILSGVIDPITAVEAMRMGAQDYVMKGDTARLIPAIQRELREAKVRRECAAEHKRVEELQRQLEAEKLVVDELHKVDQIRSQFVEMVTHELRTPMATIGSGVDLVLDGLAGAVAEKQREILQMVKRNIDRFAALLTDVVSYSRVQAGQHTLERSTFVLRSVVTHVVSSTEAGAAKKQISLAANVPDGLSVFADPEGVACVLRHLLTNAVIHNPPGTHIVVTATNGDEDFAGVSVCDNGQGIAEEATNKLFTPFYQVQRRVGAGYQGTGLGLAICRGLVHQMGGTIRVHSLPEKGSTFTFTLPKRTAGPSARAEGVSCPQKRGGRQDNKET